MFALVDCNNFYASCERLFRPDLIGKPICVLSNNDGCVIARSSEAKTLGIPMGAPAFEWNKVMIQNKVSVFSANFALYGDMSHRVMSTLADFSPNMEIYSIDEMFIDLRGFERFDLYKHACEMHESVQRCTGIPISVGMAPTKALAKLANRIAKKFSQLKGVYIMDSDLKRIKALKWLQIGDVWGIGRQHAKRLNSMGVDTAFKFTEMCDQTVRSLMGVVGLRLKHDLEGKPTLELEDVANKKSIAVTRSFDRNYKEFSEMKERVVSFAVSASEKLRKQNCECSSLMVFVHTNRFRTDLPQYNRNVVIDLPFATNSAIEISKYAVVGLQQIFSEGYSYKKAGVILNDFNSVQEHQTTLFEDQNQRHKILMATVDKLNQNFGQQKIKLASQDLRRIWKMKQEQLSPRYTTRISDLVKVIC
jgi:DNA polymerase V